MTLVNFMPLDRSHPVALELLLLNLGEAAQRVAAEDVRLLVPASATDVVTALPEGSFVTADDSFGFVYANDTAAARVLVGEKPLPSAVSGTTAGVDPLVSGEAWLCGSERKVVYVGDARVESAAQTTVAELLAPQALALTMSRPFTWAIPCVPLWCPRTLAMPSPLPATRHA